MEKTDVVVIGAGQAGLAMSHALRELGIAHVVLERGQVAQRWRSERWDSLRLLSPNWMTRLPGFAYEGPKPDGFMSMPEVIGFFERYAERSTAQVRSHTRVLRVAAHARGYRVCTDRGDFLAPNAVLATGYCDVPALPESARALGRIVHQLAPSSYQNPSALPSGGVLVVGASASGAQIADELARSGREVTLAVGRHTRLPRQYRGADILWWLDRIGSLSETVDDVRDLAASRGQPAMQLVGSEVPRDLNLRTLREAGVRVCGRLLGIEGARAWLGGELRHSIEASENKLQRLLGRIDAYAQAHPELGAEASERPAPIAARDFPSPESIDLRALGISTVIWATGYRRDYRFLELPVVDAQGELVCSRGITPAAGFYALGLRFQRTRKSSFIDGVGDDARFIARHVAARMGARHEQAA